MKKQILSTHQYSDSLGAKLGTSYSARSQRAARALHAAGIPDSAIVSIKATSQASASIVTLKAGMEVLVSYDTVVAIKFGDGRAMSQYRNYYSRTTQRSVDDFVRGQEIVDQDTMNKAIQNRLIIA